MEDSAVIAERKQRRSVAIRTLLAKPMLGAHSEPGAFSAIVKERAWLIEWFDDTLGWPLYVDVRGGFARLSKRSARLDPSRPARSTRGGKHPFDRTRYQLLCLVCAELVARPLTTIGILASEVTRAAAQTESMPAFDSSRLTERRAFIDALKLLEQWGIVSVSSGELDSYLDSDPGNALLDVSSSRLHRLLASAHAPSALELGECSAESVIHQLSHEPRYGEQPLESDDIATKNRWLRHNLARRLLDDPAVYLAELSPAERDYASSPSGRRWLLERVETAGFLLEERSEGWLAIDPDHIATDERFPAANDNAKQAALLLIDRCTHVDGDKRSLLDVGLSDLETYIAELLRTHKAWAKKFRGKNGARELAEAAVDILERFALVRRKGELVCALPAMARYRAQLVAEPDSEPKESSR